MSRPFEGAPLPDRTNVRFHKIISVPQHSPIRAVILNEVPLGMWVHYDKEDGRKGRNVPCPRVESCKLCHPPYSLTPRYCAYIGVYCLINDPSSIGLKVLALTEGMCRQLAPWIDHADALRGVQVDFQRSPEKRNGQVNLVNAKRIEPDKYGQAFDIRPHLCRFYGVRSLGQRTDFLKGDREGEGDNGAVPA